MEDDMECVALVIKDKPSRSRAPNVSYNEVNLLTELVQKYKKIVLNKAINTRMIQIKEWAWQQIEKEFNIHKLGPYRPAQFLRNKWDNLKKIVKQTAGTPDKGEDTEKVHKVVAQMILQGEAFDASVVTEELLNELKHSENDSSAEEPNLMKLLDDAENEDNNSDNSGSDYGESAPKRTRDVNFTLAESSLLLKCVRPEKDIIFVKESTGEINESKNSAWSRITDSFNKLSPTRRSSKALKMRLKTLRTAAKRKGIKPDAKPLKKVFKVVKIEPEDNSLLEEPQSPRSEHKFSGSREYTGADNGANGVDTDDPLSSVLNFDSTIGSTNMETAPSNTIQNNRVMALQTELLKYQLETAKLERQRLEQKLAEENSSREAKAVETALRLRAARLDAISAAKRFSIGDPALLFTAEEARAQSYLSQFR